MFGFIKKLIGGIFGFITGLFGKKDDYYLELKDEARETVPVAAPTPEPEAVAATKAEPVEATKTEPAKAKPAKSKPAKSKKPEPVTATKAEPATAPATETTFAPKYLVPGSSNGRRRPGANMNNFLDMASQVKVPG